MTTYIAASSGPRAQWTESVSAAVERLEQASATGTPCEPVRDLLGPTNVDVAYQVQKTLTQHRLAHGATVIGWKIGLTSRAVQEQLGVDQPDFGVLFDDMSCSENQPIPSERLLHPKAEAEIAFVLKSDLAEGQLDVEQVRAAVDYAVAAIEIVDSRIAGWDIQITDTVADNASGALFVLGQERKSLEAFAPSEVSMSMTKNGTVVSEGTGHACMGDPLNALSWLARTARQYGSPLRAGDVVLSGALGPMVSVEPGSQVTAHISSLGTVSASFSKVGTS